MSEVEVEVEDDPPPRSRRFPDTSRILNRHTRLHVRKISFVGGFHLLFLFPLFLDVFFRTIEP